MCNVTVVSRICCFCLIIIFCSLHKLVSYVTVEQSTAFLHSRLSVAYDCNSNQIETE